MPNELGLFYVALLTVPLYIQWDQLIIVEITLPTPSYQVTSNFMLDLKRLRLNLLNILTLVDPQGHSYIITTREIKLSTGTADRDKRIIQSYCS